MIRIANSLNVLIHQGVSSVKTFVQSSQEATLLELGHFLSRAPGPVPTTHRVFLRSQLRQSCSTRSTISLLSMRYHSRGRSPYPLPPNRLQQVFNLQKSCLFSTGSTSEPSRTVRSSWMGDSERRRAFLLGVIFATTLTLFLIRKKVVEHKDSSNARESIFRIKPIKNQFSFSSFNFSQFFLKEVCAECTKEEKIPIMILVNSRLGVLSTQAEKDPLLNKIEEYIERAGRMRKSSMQEDLQEAEADYQRAQSLLQRVQGQSSRIKELQEEIQRGRFELALKERMLRLLPSVKDQSELKLLVELAQEKEEFLESLLGYFKQEKCRTALDFFVQAIVFEVQWNQNPLRAIENYFHLFNWHFERENYDSCLFCIQKIFNLTKTLEDPFATANILERLNRSQIESLCAKTHSPEFQRILLQKDAVRMTFEQFLTELAPQGQNPECFICFMFEKDVTPWLEHALVPDLDLVGVKPVFCLERLGPGKELNAFQSLGRHQDRVIVVCTPHAKNECLKREKSPIGMAQEIRLIRERYNDPKLYETIYPIYLKGEREKACPSDFFEPILGTRFTCLERSTNASVFSYYSPAFELFGALKGISRRLIRRKREEFLMRTQQILHDGQIDIARLEIWRSQKSAKESLLKKSLEERISSKVRRINCPRPSLNFTGRREELDNLHQRCNSHGRVAMTGLGGLGKTAVALKYAEHYQSYYQFIHFIYGDHPQLIIDGFLKLADDLHIIGNNAEERLTALKRQLDRLEYDYLLIIDGADSPAVFEELGSLLPERGRCLLTSRMPHRAKNLNFDVMYLTPFKKEEAVDYLVNVTKNNDRDGAAILAEKLGDLPLALEHAAAYIVKRGQSFTSYLKQFEKFSLQLFTGKRVGLGENDKTILTTWKMSLDAIEHQEHCPLAKEILGFCSFLGQTAVPLALIIAWLKKYYPHYSELDLTDAIASLQAYSMIGSSLVDAFDIHPLVQEVSRFELSQKKQQEILQQILMTFSDIVEELNLNTFIDRRKLDPFVPHVEKLTEWTPYLEEKICIHILQFLWIYYDRDGKYKNAETIARLYLSQCLSKSIDQGQALNCLGISFFKISNYEEALKHHLQALELFKELLGEKHPYVAKSLNNVGLAYRELGKYKEALKYFMEALELSKELGDNHSVAMSMDNLGGTYRELGKYKEALKYHKEALELSTELLGEKHPHVAMNLHNVGLAYQKLGNYKEALKYSMKALELNKELLGEKHPYVVTSLNNVGWIYRELGNYNEALKYLMQALELSTELFGEKHPDVAMSLVNIGAIHGTVGNHKEALKYQMQALEMRKELLGEKHLDVAMSLNNVGWTYGDLGNHKEALKYQMQALELFKERLGDNHPDVAMSLDNVGGTYRKLGNYKEAFKYQMQALELRKELLGEKHPHVAMSLHNVGLTYRDLGNYREALKYSMQALEMCKELLGVKHPHVLTSLNTVEMIYRELGNYEEALKYQMQALELSKELFGYKHWSVAANLNNLGMVYAQLRNHEEALKYFLQALELKKELLGEKHPNVAMTLDNVGVAYGKLGNHKEALKYQMQALEMATELLGEKHPLTITILSNVMRTYRALGDYQKVLEWQTKILELIRE